MAHHDHGLDSLEGGTQNLLGDNSVWFELHFFSDGDNIRYQGAFVDELSISWDDGTFDLFAQIPDSRRWTPRR